MLRSKKPSMPWTHKVFYRRRRRGASSRGMRGGRELNTKSLTPRKGVFAGERNPAGDGAPAGARRACAAPGGYGIALMAASRYEDA
ncbi:hypothetical protein EVAR_18840_1 [Eumeta japonica]|uniref:Uncharacterized protein n=1 Tax=Eumeta variegata TaxID=151549 RepID=A0A4C1ULL9_EUMVA|nr:hypothetical protein EVAR_18840_1 [Eumeta japonica]